MLFIFWSITWCIGIISVNAELWKDYCECWDFKFRNNEYRNIKYCLEDKILSLYKEEEEPTYTKDEARECWETQNENVPSLNFRFKVNTPLCVAIRIYDASVLALDDIQELGLPQHTDVILIVKFLLEFIGAGDRCKDFLNQFSQRIVDIKLNQILVSLNMLKDATSGGGEGTGEENCDPFDTQMTPKLTWWTRQRPNKLIELVTEVCKHNMKPSACSYLLVYHIADVYVGHRNDAGTDTSLCDALRLFLIYYDIQLTSGNGYQQQIGKTPRRKVLRRTLTSMAKIISKRGLKDKRIKFYYRAADQGITNNWFKLVGKFCESQDANSGDISKPLFCNIFPVLQQLVESWRDFDTKEPLIDTEMRYEEYLSLEGIKLHTDITFSNLGGYLRKVQSFDRQKALHYANYARKQLDNFNSTLQEVSTSVGNNMGELINNAIKSSSFNLVEKTARMTLAVCLAANPFSAAQPAALQASEEWTQSISQVARAAKLKSYLEDLQKESKRISKGFQKNRATLDAAKSFLKTNEARFSLDQSVRQYLNEYGKYDPGVSRGEIANLQGFFRKVIDEACKVLGETQGNIASTIVMAESTKGGHCTRTRADAERIGMIFLEIYDFQRTYLEHTASYLRAKLSEENAKLLGTREVNRLAPGLDPDQIVELATLCYKIEVYNIVYKFCDVLEYKNCGVRPEECEQHPPNISKLKGRKIMFRQEYTYYVNIPDSGQNVNDHRESTIDTQALFEGTNVSVTIPNYDWLVKYAGFPPKYSDSPIYVKRFSIILPTVSGSKRIKSSGMLYGVHGLFPNGRNYALAQAYKTDLYYTLAATGKVCQKEEKTNPYTIWKSKPLPKICPQSTIYDGNCDDTSSIVPYPSIYGRWKFYISADDNRLITIPATKTSVKALLVVCRPNQCQKAKGTKIEVDETLAKEAQQTTSEGQMEAEEIEKIKMTPCKGTEYWDQDNSRCESCPESSTSKLEGYFCEYTQEAIREYKKRKQNPSTDM